MVRKRKNKDGFLYSKNEAFENLETAQQMALNRKGKDDEVCPDISIFLKAEELKGKLCGLYSEKDKPVSQIRVMGSVKINGEELKLNVGENIKMENNDD